MTDTACIAEQLSVRSGVDQSAVALGRSFVQASADECLKTVDSVYGKMRDGQKSLKESELETLKQVCNQVYRGGKLANQECGADEDCVSGLVCDLGKGGPSGRCGTKTVVLQGAGCANVGEICPLGFFCGNSDGVWVCQPKLGLAAACDAAPCLENLRCSGGICVSLLTDGQACTVGDECASGFCEPYVRLCAEDVGFAPGSISCLAMGQK
jgi:hypothetical protein